MPLGAVRRHVLGVRGAGARAYQTSAVVRFEDVNQVGLHCLPPGPPWHTHTHTTHLSTDPKRVNVNTLPGRAVPICMALVSDGAA